jgi:hypothetical protein
MLSHQIHLGQDSQYAKEMRKHEAFHSAYGPPGRPYQFREYPSMLYKPTRAKDSGVVTYEASEAANDSERERLERCGFVHGGKGAALAALEKQEFEFAELAANRAVTDQRMGELARAEAVRVDDATIQHLPVIPEKNDRPDHMKGARK